MSRHAAATLLILALVVMAGAADAAPLSADDALPLARPAGPYQSSLLAATVVAALAVSMELIGHLWRKLFAGPAPRHGGHSGR